MDITKIANLILYAIDKKVEHLNDKKLSILLFLIDHEFLQTNGSKIFDDEYIKESRHPEPKLLTEIFEVLANNEDLEDSDFKLDLIQELLSFIEINIVEKAKYIELKFSIYEEEFDNSIFTKTQFDIINKYIKKYKATTARNMANDCFKIDMVRETKKGEIIL